MTPALAPRDALVVYSAHIREYEGEAYSRAPLRVVLDRVTGSDACILQYTEPCRLGVKDASADVVMAWCAIDQDCRPSKAWRKAWAKANPGQPVPPLPPELEAELQAFRARQYALAAKCPWPCAMWDSPNGVRQLRALNPGVTALDFDVRATEFLRTLEAYGFEGLDMTSAEWTRHQRLPRGGKVTGWPGYLELPPAPEGWTPRLPSAVMVDGDVTECLTFLMYAAAVADGVPGLEIDHEVKADFLAVRCPWDDEHSDPGAVIGKDCCITADRTGTGMGGLSCFHAHSGGDPNTRRDGYGVREWLAARSPKAKALLEAHDNAKRDRAAEMTAELERYIAGNTTKAESVESVRQRWLSKCLQYKRQPSADLLRKHAFWAGRRGDHLTKLGWDAGAQLMHLGADREVIASGLAAGRRAGLVPLKGR